MFIEALGVGNLYVSLKTDMPTSYAMAIRQANRYANTEEAVRQKRKQEGSVGAKCPRAPEGGRPDQGDHWREFRMSDGMPPPQPT